MTSRISSSTDLKTETDRAMNTVPRKNAGFFVRQRELARRRLWPIALTLLSHLIYYIVCTATVLSNTLEYAAINHLTAAETTEALQKMLRELLGYQNISWALITLPLAAMLAIEGFAWLHSRREVDFYESLPVSRRLRFFDICIGSMLIFVLSCLLTLGIGLVIAGGFGALSHAVLIEILQETVKTIALFIAVYALGVLSAMLTGNILVACLAFGVLLFYETLFRTILKGYCSEFFATWSYRPSSLMTRCTFSPISQFLDNSDFVEAALRLLALGALFFLLSWVCFRLRRNELAGTAVIFGPVRSVVRIAMALLTGLSTGLLVTSIRAGRGIVLSVIWMILFTVITACIMQIIYEYDFRALFRRPLEIAAAVVLALLLYMGFAFDVTGYDRFVPAPDKVTDAALICTDAPVLFSTEEGFPATAETFGEQYMHLKNVDDVIAVAAYGQAFTRQSRGTTEDAGPDADMENVPADGQGIPHAYEEFSFLVVYRMKNGKTVTRAFRLPSTTDPAMMSAVIDTEQYREGSFAIYHDKAIRTAADSLLVECTNGKDVYSGDLTAEQYEAFRKACLADLEGFTYSFARENVPVAYVKFSYQGIRKDDRSPEYENPAVSCPVYPSFSNTIQVLDNIGVWPEPLDYTTILRGMYDYDSLSSEEQELYDSVDAGVFSGPFNNSTIFGTPDFYY